VTFVARNRACSRAARTRKSVLPYLLDAFLADRITKKTDRLWTEQSPATKLAKVAILTKLWHWFLQVCLASCQLLLMWHRSSVITNSSLSSSYKCADSFSWWIDMKY